MSAISVNPAEDQARKKLEAIIAMVRRLEHISECKNPDCDLADVEVLSGLNIGNSGRPAARSERKKYHSDEDAYETIIQSFLRLAVWGLWYELVFYCDGGHLSRITGELSQNRVPETVKYEYCQGRVTPWTDYPLTSTEQLATLNFANCYAGHFGVAIVPADP